MYCVHAGHFYVSVILVLRPFLLDYSKQREPLAVIIYLDEMTLFYIFGFGVIFR